MIVGGFIPVRSLFVRVVGQADFFDPGLPVVARRNGDALHQDAELEAEPPKPPRDELPLLEKLPLLDPLRVEPARCICARRAASTVGREAVTVGVPGWGDQRPP